MLEILSVNPGTERLWDEFVKKNLEREYAFSLGWRNLLRDVFGYKSVYYMIAECGRISGIFPLYLADSGIFGARFISIPFADFGGFYFSPSVEDSVKRQAGIEILGRLNADFLLPQGEVLPIVLGGPQEQSNKFLEEIGFSVFNPYVKFKVRLDRPWEEISSGFDRNIIRNLKKTNGQLSINVLRDKLQLEAVYLIYLEDIRRLGSPPLPKSFFEGLWDEFYSCGGFTVLTASRGGRIVGAITLIASKRTVYADLIMSRAADSGLHPKTQLYLASLRYAWNAKKYTVYDFGRTRRGSGVFEYKRKWGGWVEDIVYMQSRSDTGRTVFLDAQQLRFRAAGRIIKHLPLSILRRWGWVLRRHAGK